MRGARARAVREFEPWGMADRVARTSGRSRTDLSPTFKLVITAGGLGSRLHPISTAERPKQFLNLIDPLRTMLQLTADRFIRGQNAPLVPEQLFVVTNSRHVPLVKEQLPEIPDQNIIGEPISRSTGPAISSVMFGLAREDPSTVAVFVPADHYIGDTAAYLHYIGEAVRYAAGHRQIVTLGIDPTWASPEYGYIKQGKAFLAAQFVQKPNERIANGFLQAGGYLWNSGVLVAGAGNFLSILSEHLPNWLEGLTRSFDENLGARALRLSMERFYGSTEPVSIDTALLEPASLRNQIAVVPMGDIGWSDVGTKPTLLALVRSGLAVPSTKILRSLEEEFPTDPLPVLKDEPPFDLQM